MKILNHNLSNFSYALSLNLWRGKGSLHCIELSNKETQKLITQVTSPNFKTTLCNAQKDAKDNVRCNIIVMYVRYVVAICLLSVSVNAQTLNSRKDSIGQTHFDGVDRNGNHFSGISRRDSIGQTHTSIRSDNRTIECLGQTNSLGYTRQECH
jgi:hypothetical protein